MTAKTTSLLNAVARSAIVRTFVECLDAVDNSGSMVTQVCNTAQKYAKGQDIPGADAEGIADAIAESRGYNTETAKVRKSEIRTILKAYTSLGECVSGLAKATNKCNWHDALKMARRVNKGDSIKQAVAYVQSNKSDAKSAHPAGRVAAGLKAWHTQSRGDKRAVIEKAAALLSTIGLKVSF